MAASPSESSNPFAALAAEATSSSSSSSSSSKNDGAKASPLSPEEVEKKVQEALACPCIADFRDGPCGPSFVAAFSCFLRSQHSASSSGSSSSSSSSGGSNAAAAAGGGANVPECLGAFEAMQACMVKHPEAFTDFVKSKEEAEADEDADEEDKKK